jgi:asparagine synthase (glutamine-hydrolysing)
MDHPVPALSHLEGPVLDLVAEAPHARAARERALFRPEAVNAMLAAPNEHRTNLDASALWQLGLLELWLQTHLDA